VEEEFMQKIRFPNSETHKKEHDIFLQKLVAMHREYLGGKRSLSLEMLGFITNWLTTHILVSDAETGRFLAVEQAGESQGIRN
jgi:hemerythrin